MKAVTVDQNRFHCPKLRMGCKGTSDSSSSELHYMIWTYKELAEC